MREFGTGVALVIALITVVVFINALISTVSFIDNRYIYCKNKYTDYSDVVKCSNYNISNFFKYELESGKR